MCSHPQGRPGPPPTNPSDSEIPALTPQAVPSHLSPEAITPPLPFRGRAGCQERVSPTPPDRGGGRGGCPVGQMCGARGEATATGRGGGVGWGWVLRPPAPPSPPAPALSCRCPPGPSPGAEQLRPSPHPLPLSQLSLGWGRQLGNSCKAWGRGAPVPSCSSRKQSPCPGEDAGGLGRARPGGDVRPLPQRIWQGQLKAGQTPDQSPLPLPLPSSKGVLGAGEAGHPEPPGR